MDIDRFNTLAADTVPIEQSGLSLDVALLIASAIGKGIQPSLWLTEQIDAGIRPFNDFSSKLISLGLAVGIQEDKDTKTELDNGGISFYHNNICVHMNDRM
jgi:hypothetical protein